MESSIDIHQLQQTLGYTFNELNILEEALRHSSFVNEQNEADLRDNERLEFLGDAVLNLVIGDLLMSTYPDMREGDLSRIRSNLVNESRLADISKQLLLGNYLMLGKGEIQTKGREKSSILADALEALLAAVYLDGGYDSVFELVKRHFQTLIDSAQKHNVIQDYKSRLQEAVQSNLHQTPDYEVVNEFGPDHDKTFQVVMRVGEIETQGEGKSKKAAEQDAARRALDTLSEQD
ncbi:MAG: ribonuclease III [Desulfobacteraceae bacterium]|nr:ribonuclease III [Desulfobacteraceae bacterium]